MEVVGITGAPSDSVAQIPSQESKFLVTGTDWAPAVCPTVCPCFPGLGKDRALALTPEELMISSGDPDSVKVEKTREDASEQAGSS